MAEPNLKKQLKIKTGALKRIQKEYQSYKTEENKQQLKIQQMTEADPQNYNLKKENELLEETKAMLPNCKTRLQDCYNDMICWMQEYQNNEAIKESEEKTQAEECINLAKVLLDQLNSLE